MNFASASSITGLLHLVQLAPVHEPAVLLLIGAGLVAVATMVRSSFSD
jgi:hypothetical protein